MRENGRKSEYKSYRKYGRVRSALHRWTAIALGVVLLAGQLETSVYAMEEPVVYSAPAADDAAEYVPTEQTTADTDEGDVSEQEDQEGETPEESEEEKSDTEEPPAEGDNDGDDLTGGDGEGETGEENGDDETPEDENGEDEIFDEEVTEEESTGDENAEEIEEEENLTLLGEDGITPRASSTIKYNKMVFWKEEDNQVSLWYLEGTIGGHVEIPATVEDEDNNTYTVTAIISCKSDDLTSVSIPGSVKNIGENAFWRCPNLTSVSMSNGVISIEKYAFGECPNLESVVIPGSVTDIGERAFYNCSKLKRVEIKDGGVSQSIGKEAFLECSSLENAIISDSVTNIGQSAFSLCGLTEFKVPKGIKRISSQCFSGCGALTDITILENVTSIDQLAFSGCRSLTEIKIPDKVTFIGMSAFHHCTGLSDVTIPASVTGIGIGAFNGCSSLASATIMPGSVTNMSISLFQDCSSLTSVTIPDSVGTISQYAFLRCTSLNSLNIAISKSDTVKVSGIDAFQECPGEREISFWTADEKTKLTGKPYSDARGAYLAINDGNTKDDQWYGWTIPEIESVAKTYTITATTGEGGTITPSGDVLVAEGDDQTFTITPNANEGYQLESIVVDEKEVKADGESEVTARDAAATAKTYTFTDVRDNHTIAVSFEKVSGGDTPPGDDTPPSGGDDTPPSGGGDTSPGNDTPPGGNDEPDGDSSGGGNDNDAVLVAENADTSIVTLKAAPAKAAPEADSPAIPKNTQGKEPKTGDPTHVEIYATIAMIAGFTYLLLYFIEERRGMTEREKEVFVAAFIRWAKKGGTFRRCCALAAIFCILVYYHSIGKRTRGQVCPAQN